MSRQRKPEETYCNFANFKSVVDSKTDINQNGVQIIKNLSRIMQGCTPEWRTKFQREITARDSKRDQLSLSVYLVVSGLGRCKKMKDLYNLCKSGQ